VRQYLKSAPTKSSVDTAQDEVQAAVRTMPGLCGADIDLSAGMVA
jgi:hypothetical protein